jgi:hypothetical protein
VSNDTVAKCDVTSYNSVRYNNVESGNQSSSVSVGAGRPVFGCRQEKGFFLFAMASRLAVGSTTPPIQWVPVTRSFGIK